MQWVNHNWIPASSIAIPLQKCLLSFLTFKSLLTLQIFIGLLKADSHSNRPHFKDFEKSPWNLLKALIKLQFSQKRHVFSLPGFFDPFALWDAGFQSEETKQTCLLEKQLFLTKSLFRLLIPLICFFLGKTELRFNYLDIGELFFFEQLVQKNKQITDKLLTCKNISAITEVFLINLTLLHWA